MTDDRERQAVLAEALLAERGYFCRRVLGQGAFSRVYWVEQRDGRSCACKVSGNVRLLEREARNMAGPKHPLFPMCFEMWREEGLGFLMMEYVQGIGMEEMLHRRGRFSVRQAVRMGMELAEGLSCLHEGAEGLLFRDVKPANSIIRQDGRIRLLDFGCACALGERASSRAGTPGFAAPEQLEGERILTAACDVYGWGQTMKAILGAAGPRGGAALRVEPESDVRTEPRGGAAPRVEPEPDGRAEMYRGPRRETASCRRTERKLLRILEACTRKEASERIPRMRDVMALLEPLYVESGGGRLEGAVPLFGRGTVCHKNIVAMGKNT